MNFEIRGILFKGGDCWCILGLEFDYFAESYMLKDVKYEFEKLLAGYIIASHDSQFTLS